MSFDPIEYTTVPTRNSAATLGLARALLSAAARPNRLLAQRLSKLHDAAIALQEAWIAASRPEERAEDPRPYDQALDRAWAALRARLQAWVQLGLEPEQSRAAELLEVLFPDGLDFLQLPFTEQWAQSERRLVQIDDDGLEGALDDLADPRFLAAIAAAHAEYGRVLGITDRKPPLVDPARVVEPLRRTRAAIGSYARAVVGMTDEDDEVAVASMKARLRPIIEIRRPRAKADEERDEAEETVSEPLPAVPEAS